MALWKETTTPATAGTALPPLATPTERPPLEANTTAAPRRPVARTEAGGESVIAANLSIEGKIEGSGNVRIAGRF